jgi:hypothetical protein
MAERDLGVMTPIDFIADPVRSYSSLDKADHEPSADGQSARRAGTGEPLTRLIRPI